MLTESERTFDAFRQPDRQLRRRPAFDYYGGTEDAETMRSTKRWPLDLGRVNRGRSGQSINEVYHLSSRSKKARRVNAGLF